jgi:hypothetical protein
VVGAVARLGGSDRGLIILMIAASAAIGLVAAAVPLIAFVVALAAGVALLLALGRRLSILFLALTAVLLLGYMLFDKSFAYLGVYPVFIGEIVLAVALLHLLLSIPRIRLGWVHWILIGFMFLGLIRTLPYLETYGIDALRDGALWGYGLFAFAIYVAASEKLFKQVIYLYGLAVLPFLLWTPVGGLIARFYDTQLPTVLGSNVSVILLKSGDIGVHLGGIAALMIVGFAHRRLTGPAAEVLVWTLWLVGVGIVGSTNRGSLLAAGIAFAAAIVLMPPARRFAGRFVLAAVVAFMLALVTPQIAVASQRSLSLEQIGRNITSIVSDTGADELDGTKRWRTLWWNAILDYTFAGPYFWSGKGFGINLANEDGFQVDTEGETLRSPHDAHLTVLARMGVPGLALWVLLQVAFGVSLFWAYVRARQRGAMFWRGVDTWLIAYWLAMLVNASFDVYLEGPQGGIWFWSVFGLGLGAVAIQANLFRKTQAAPQLPVPAAAPTYGSA